MADTDIGTGASIAFDSGFLAEITNIDWGGIERVAVNTSHLLTTPAHTHIPGDLYDSGELSVDIHFDPDLTPPFNDVTETVTLTFPLPAGKTTAAKWVAQGFFTGIEPGIPLEDKMVATVTLKLTGEIVVTASA